MTTLFKQMTVCGVGLIGGSLALIAKREGLVERIVGLGRTQANLDVALERGLIDFATRDPAAGRARRRPGDAGGAGLHDARDAGRDDSVSAARRR